MKKLAPKIAAIFPMVSLSILLTISSCSNQVKSIAIPFIPPTYYDCIETDSHALTQSYFDIRYLQMKPDDVNPMKNQVFVLKNIRITENDMKHANDKYIWVDNLLKCYFWDTANLRQLQANENVDLVGVFVGACPEYPGTLTLTGCILLPSDTVQLPAPGSTSKLATGY